MRFRPLASLSVAAAAVLLIAGCSASAPDSEQSASAAGDLCGAAAASGAASDSVTTDYTRRGVPQSISIDPSTMVADDETYYSVSVVRVD